MLQSQEFIGNGSNANKKQHSRKQLTQWISKQAQIFSKTNSVNSCHFQNLKSGVFFLYILQKVLPNQSHLIKSKIKQKPVSEYQFNQNLQLLKKILNKHNLQNNLNISEICKPKYSFDFLNWMKNLNDGLINLGSHEQYYKVESQKVISPEKNYNLNSGYKTNRQSSSSKSGTKRLSEAKSNRNYSTSKSQNPFYKIKSGKNLVEVSNKQLPVLNNNRSHVITLNKTKRSTYMSQFDSLDDCNEALYEKALQESIQSLRGILYKVKEKAILPQQFLEVYLNQINQAIFSKP